jgi:putative RNA 2'-phosphotransferase
MGTKEDGFDYRRLSKTSSHALRHEPEKYGLELDAGGWVEVGELVRALRGARRAWSGVDRGHVERMVEGSPKDRFELDGDRIRARYGHSVEGVVAREPGEPPEELYHGAPVGIVGVILEEGLKPMSRQYVHMAVDVPGAIEVGRRKGGETALLVVRARAASEAGVRFYEGNDHVWLADHVPGAFIEVRGR